VESTRTRGVVLVQGRRISQPRAEELAIEIVEAEIRSAQYEVWLEAAKLVLTDNEPMAIARHLRERAERTISVGRACLLDDLVGPR
jgi:hypothetical protein